MKRRRTGKTLVKMDVEGAEYEVLASLLTRGALCHAIDYLTVEWHLKLVPMPSNRSAYIQSKNDARQFSRFVSSVIAANADRCRLKRISVFDDESYVNDKNESASIQSFARL